MFLGESDSWLFYYILSPYRHSQHIAPCIRPVLMLDIWDTFHWYAFTCTDCPLCTCAHNTGLDSVSCLRPESFPYIIWDSCQCVWVCPHPESIRGQFHPAPQCSPTLSQLGHRELLKSNAHSARHELQIQLLRHHPQSLREADACLCVIIQTMRLNDLMAPPCCQARSSGVRNMSVCMSVSPSRFDLGSVSSSTSMDYELFCGLCLLNIQAKHESSTSCWERVGFWDKIWVFLVQ